MRRMIFTLLLLGVLAAGAWAQAVIFENPEFQKLYVVSREATLAGAAEVVTIQQPEVNSGQNFFFDGVAVYCSVDCTFTVERNGTAATGTALKPTSVNPGIVAAKAEAFHTSNVGASTVIAKYYVPAGSEKVVSLRGLRLRARTQDNLTIRTSTVTGTVRILVKWGEKQR